MHFAFGDRMPSVRTDQIDVQTLVMALTMVMRHEFGSRFPHRPLTEQDHPRRIPFSCIQSVQRARSNWDCAVEASLRQHLLGPAASGAGVHPDALIKWAEAKDRMQPYWIRWLALILAILAATGWIQWVYHGIFNFRLDALLPLILTVLVEAGIWYCFRNSGKRVLAGSEYAFRDLNLLCGMLAQIETQQFTTPYLQLLQSEMRSGAVTASRAMAASAGSSIGRNRSAAARPRPRGT
jgi:hypothetical protein